jgi:hypothetical protein
MTDQDPDPRTPEQKLAELEWLSAEQDRTIAINDKARALMVRVATHYPELDLDQHLVKWFEFPDPPDDDRLVLQLDGGVAQFEMHGDDLHATGPLPDDLVGREGDTIPDEHGRPFPLAVLRGKVPCIVWRPDGSRYLAAYADDPFGPEQADLN